MENKENLEEKVVENKETTIENENSQQCEEVKLNPNFDPDKALNDRTSQWTINAVGDEEEGKYACEIDACTFEDNYSNTLVVALMMKKDKSFDIIKQFYGDGDDIDDVKFTVLKSGIKDYKDAVNEMVGLFDENR